MKFKRAFLGQIQTGAIGARAHWQRFVVIKADAANAAAMNPRITQGSMLLVDRHYNSLKPYRREPNLYVVLKEKSLLVRFVEMHNGRLLLRPTSSSAGLLTLTTGRRSPEALIGRVCYVAGEA
jgi:hypothetical protein